MPNGSSAIVFAELGGESEVFTFAGHDGDFTRDIAMTVPGGASRQFPVTLLVRASRDTAATAVRIDVDSVDCSVDFGPRAP